MLSRLLVAGLLLWACGAAAEPQVGVAAAEPKAGTAAAGSLPGAQAVGDVLTTAAAGKVTVRAFRLPGPLRVDGQLDEAVYRDVPAISEFIMAEPRSGGPPSQKTEAWVLFDDEAIYVSVRCWESNLAGMIADEMRRDNINITQQEFVGFGLDPFHDRRNGLVFNVTPLGAFMDGQVTDDRAYNGDWNPVWQMRSGRFDGGWTVEARVPFKSLRYRGGEVQVWGFELRRENKWKNEISYITPMPRTFASRGLQQVSQWATLVGLRVPPRGVRLDLKPYVIGSVSTDRTGVPPVSNDPSGDVGMDAKWGITDNLSADLTYNTDFAQVEADEQQVNLTRFSLFFPEKRDFFLENQGIFGVGGSSGGDTPIPFYSRRIGLGRGQVVPIDGGGRLTGRMGPFVIGVVDIQSGEVPAAGSMRTNFGVARVKRDILRRSSIGAMATYRSRGETAPGRNTLYGVDSTLSFFRDVFVNAYWARTETDAAGVRATTPADVSYRAQLDWTGDRWGAQAERLYIGPRFDPGIGFVRRADMEKTQGLFRFSPRPATVRAIRKYTYQVSGSSIENSRGRVESQDLSGQFGIEFQNGDRVNAQVNQSFEYLPLPFRVATGVTLPVRGYSFQDLQASFTLAQQRRLSGTVSMQVGEFYNGTIRAAGFTGGRFEFSKRFSMEPSVTLTWVDLPAGAFTNRLVGSRVTFTFAPRMFASALIQYSSASRAFSTNARLRWEYTPGSEFFVVYNEQRDTRFGGVPDLQNRTVIVKFNRMFRIP